ncbi:DUF3293 domain-containing protein [Roseococcus sp. SYP-B2431]|uniref:DUF3293 domain-containing protein n=1 Tax=Roseococcus sp. SYP-B2431 TaxID=2496640 RepID=UPI0010389107|nr:DUF3293 domain-containing protein [Roseococcus sp. SYP-B2431]TCH99385.1 DUF3293 domain-containing protein [Roseococcus sp. SYP-B2431]
MTRDAAYRRTLYRSGGVVVRVGWRSASAEAWMARHGAHEAWFLGAWNPFSRRMPPRWNEAAHRRLRRDVASLPASEAEGSLGRWSEDMLLLAARTATIRRLMRRYRQAAVVHVPRQRRARLLWQARPMRSWASKTFQRMGITAG